MRFLVVSTAVVSSALALACGPAPNTVRSAARTPVTPAGSCACDDDDGDADDEAPRRRPVEYVKLRDWQPPPSVEELEASLPPRGAEPASFTTFPQLTLHKPIGDSSYRSRWRGNVHAK